jgi:dihydropteroate synthase
MKPLNIANHTFDWGARTYVMGILNITPDSFSGDGLLHSDSPLPLGEGPGVRESLEQARSFSPPAQYPGRGGESPSARTADAGAEMERVIPVVQALSKEFPDTLISIDTYKATVAEEALKVGAHIVNDVWALRADPALAGVAAKHEAPVILMHNRSNPASVEVRAQLGNAYIGAEYDDLLADVKRELLDSVKLAQQAGIPDERIILDPGIGFGKTVAHNLELIRRLDEIRVLGYPVLLGASRKSFIGFALDLPADQRVEGTAAAVCVGITRGADIIRVHDVEHMVRIAKMTDAIVRK